MLTTIFLSPAKALDLSALTPQQSNKLDKIDKLDHQTQAFQPTSGFKFQESQMLADYLCQKTSTELAELLDISKPLADLNHTRYQQYWQHSHINPHQITPEMKPAAFTFNGDAYQHLDINSLEVEQLAYLNQHLLIFSGLYGFLNAFDYIKPYRIDMGTDIALAYKGTFFKNLYQIWQPILVNAWFEMHISPLLDPINNINNIKEMEEMKDCKDIYVINLASKEYAKAFELKYLNPKNQALLSQHHLKIKIVDIDFKQRKKDGGFASIGIKNKQARGAFLRYMAQNQVFNLEKCCEFAEDDYIFSPRQSTFINHKTDKIHLTFVQG